MYLRSESPIFIAPDFGVKRPNVKVTTGDDTENRVNTMVTIEPISPKSGHIMYLGQEIILLRFLGQKVIGFRFRT